MFSLSGFLGVLTKFVYNSHALEEKFVITMFLGSNPLLQQTFLKHWRNISVTKQSNLQTNEYLMNMDKESNWQWNKSWE